MNRYRLRKLPSWQHYVQGTSPSENDPPGWSGRGSLATPPPVGTPVIVRINGIGPGTVRGYFVEHGFLGVEVRVDDPPAWWRKQNGRARIARVFGTEIIGASAEELNQDRERIAKARGAAGGAS